MQVWRERKLARRLKALGTPPPGASPREAPPGPYHLYEVEHEHRVCPSCHAHLDAGGKLHGAARNRGRLAFLVLVGILALLILTLPLTLPRLISALWLMPGEGGR